MAKKMQERGTARAIELKASAPDAGKAIDRWLGQDQGLGPRTALKKAFLERKILINGAPAQRTTKLRPGDVVIILSESVFRREELRVQPNGALSLDVLVETQELVVVNKPAGQSVHPLKPTDATTTLSALASQYPDCATTMAPDRPLEGGLVHRLDRGTSGLLTCARTPQAWKQLRELWATREIEKVYLAWVEGFLERQGRVEFFLSHDPKSRKRMQADPMPPKGEKSWRALSSFMPVRTALLPSHEPVTLVAVRIHTGVMHQIRVSMATLGHPVLGDDVYSGLRSKRPSPAVLAAVTHMEEQTHVLLDDVRYRALLKSSSPTPEPTPELLPLNGFFLHAAWLRARSIPALASGIYASPPPHFGL